MASTSAKKFSVLLRVLAESRQCWPHLVAVAFLSLLSLPLTLLYPLPLKIVVDSVLGGKPLPAFLTRLLPMRHGSETLLWAVGLVLGIAVLVNLQGFATWWLQTYIGERLVWDFRAKLLNHVQRLPLYFHDRYGSSDSVYRIQHDAPSIQYVAIQGLIPLMTAVFTLAGMIYVTMRIDVWLALTALTITPLLFVLTLACSRLVRQRSQVVKELDSSAMSVIQEVLGCVRVIKAFGQEDRELARFVRRSGKRLSGQVKLSLWQAVFNVLIGLTIAAGTAVGLYIGVKHVRAGVLSVGSLLVVMAYIAQIYQPLQLLTTKTTDLQAWITSLERTFVLLHQTPEIAENADALALSRARGTFEFRNVSFQYAGSGRGLKNISFTIPAGARVGIVGSTGPRHAFLGWFSDNVGKRQIVDIGAIRYSSPRPKHEEFCGAECRLFAFRSPKLCDFAVLETWCDTSKERVAIFESCAASIEHTRHLCSYITASRSYGFHFNERILGTLVERRCWREFNEIFESHCG